MHRQFVEYAVYKFVAVGAAEGFGHFNGFVDDHRIRGFGHGGQFVAGHQQHGAFDGAQIVFIAVEQRADLLHVIALVGVGAKENGGKQRLVGFGKIAAFADVLRHFGGAALVERGLVKCLHGKFAGAAAGGFHKGFLAIAFRRPVGKMFAPTGRLNKKLIVGTD